MKINPEMIVLARESRGLTQGQLAKAMDISQSALSKYENGLLDVSDEHLKLLASVLQYRETFFSRPDLVRAGSTCMYHRKRSSVPAGELRRIHSSIVIKEQNIKRLLRSVELEPALEFPQFDFDAYGDPETIANLLRKSWLLTPGPIRNLVTTIERAGGIVIAYHFGTQKMDAVSRWTDSVPPLFFINLDLPWERIRFSLAHELGHIVMHRNASLNQEREADAFASAFLMPAQDILPEFSESSLESFARLKPYWRVSIQALIRRAYDLKRITEDQYRRLFTMLSKAGYRKNEPFPISSEEPYTANALIKTHLQDHRYTEIEMSQLFDIPLHKFAYEYLTSPTSHIRVVK